MVLFDVVQPWSSSSPLTHVWAFVAFALQRHTMHSPLTVLDRPSVLVIQLDLYIFSLKLYKIKI